MIAFLTEPGFLGTRARLYADVALVLVLLTAILFTVGWRLAVSRRLDAHAWVQTGAFVLNSAAVLIVMLPSFVIYILPGVPAKLLEGTYGLTVLHAVIGTAASLMGLWVVLRAHGHVPSRLKFEHYKPYMRASYALYMLATLVGLIVYAAVYIAPE